MGLLGAVMAGEAEAAATGQVPQTPATAGAPPAFGTAPPVGPEVSTETFVEAEKLMQVTMSVNGTKVAESNLPKTIPLQISLGEGMDIGQDVGSAVDFTYKLPFAFTGKIDKVAVELSPLQTRPASGQQ